MEQRSSRSERIWRIAFHHSRLICERAAPRPLVQTCIETNVVLIETLLLIKTLSGTKQRAMGRFAIWSIYHESAVYRISCTWSDPVLIVHFNDHCAYHFLFISRRRRMDLWDFLNMKLSAKLNARKWSSVLPIRWCFQAIYAAVPSCQQCWLLYDEILDFRAGCRPALVPASQQCITACCFKLCIILINASRTLIGCAMFQPMR